jgi:hypothetical protein
MKTKITILIGVLLSVCVSKTGFAQADNAGPTGHQRAAGQYLGWDATGVAGTLDIRNDFNNQPIDFFSNGIQRMRIAAGNATAPTTGTPTAGFVGIGPHPSLYSRLTISNIATGAVGGYRPWMQTGVFSHQGTDAMYVGLRQMGDVGNRFDATIA